MTMALFKSKEAAPDVDFDHLPGHVAIIMDGNGRWAKKRGLPRTAGHAAGAETFRTIATYCKDIGLEYLSVYAFSTENWKRPQEEIDALMNLLRNALRRTEHYKEENVRVLFLGDRSPLADDLQDMMARVEEASADRDGLTLNIALNYGGRDELVQAARALAGQVEAGTLRPEEIDEQRLAGCLYTAGQPDVDLIIRPSGELRLSNFLTWQSAYAELLFMDVLWPDFNEEHLRAALWEYARRNRRFGGL